MNVEQDTAFKIRAANFSAMEKEYLPVSCRANTDDSIAPPKHLVPGRSGQAGSDSPSPIATGPLGRLY